MSLELTPVTPRSLTFTPVNPDLDPGGVESGPFAQVKRDYPSFGAVKAAFATFADLKAATAPELGP